MPRRKVDKKIAIPEDPIYGSKLVTKLINRSMKDGKKSVAQKQVYRSFEIIKKETKIDPLIVFNKAIENVRPKFEVRSRRVGGAAYQVPIQVRGLRQNSLAIRWIILAARAKPNKQYHTYGEKLAAELIDAFNEAGGAFTRKKDIEKLAEANRAFAHLRW